MSRTYTLEEIRKMKSRTDLDRVRSTTEKDIKEQSIADPDTPYLTEKELREFTTPQKRKERDTREQGKPEK